MNIITPTSYHTGGVQLALADGSVTFISETINVGTLPNAAKNMPTFTSSSCVNTVRFFWD